VLRCILRPIFSLDARVVRSPRPNSIGVVVLFLPLNESDIFLASLTFSVFFKVPVFWL
jgi:hypothetical protein